MSWPISPARPALRGRSNSNDALETRQERQRDSVRTVSFQEVSPAVKDKRCDMPSSPPSSGGDSGDDMVPKKYSITITRPEDDDANQVVQTPTITDLPGGYAPQPTSMPAIKAEPEEIS